VPIGIQDRGWITRRTPIEEVLLAAKTSPLPEEPQGIPEVPPTGNRFHADSSGWQEQTWDYRDREECDQIPRRWEVHEDRIFPKDKRERSQS
jgi:hypothetical protein